MTLKNRRARRREQTQQFTYESESNIAGGLTAITDKRVGPVSAVGPASAVVVGNRRPSPSAEIRGASATGDRRSPSAGFDAEGSLTDGIGRGRALLQSAADERFRILLGPHIAAFTSDVIDEVELARCKAQVRKQVESEISSRRESLDECEELLGPLAKDYAHVNSLIEQLKEATIARDEAEAKLVGKLQGALREAAVPPDVW